MKTKTITILAVVIFLPVSQVQAVNVDFYSDAIIGPGDVFDVVTVYDTPPDNTTVHMFGGSVYRFRTYGSSIVNIFAGELERGGVMWESSTMNIYGGDIILEGPRIDGSSTLNIYGGDVGMGSPSFDEFATLNIYGYDFNYNGFTLTGFLSDDSPFEFIEIHGDDYSHINLIVIPEPGTLLLLGLGALLLRKRIYQNTKTVSVKNLV